MAESVDVRVVTLELPTYLRGPDNPFPFFTWSNWRYHYPYSAQTDLSNDQQVMQHRAVVLENRYVRVTVLPDLGGKIFSLFDKVAGKDCFMVPPGIKYQNISLRGAWIAGGIELNYGTAHHTVHTVNPITWCTTRDEDGGGSVWVGSVTRPVESRYACRIRLRPERSAMDLEIHSMGPLMLPGMMYWWTNTAVEVGQDSRFFYFGRYAEGRHSWPVFDGLDYSHYRNRLSGGDMFLMESQRDYMAFYDDGRRHGVANIADRYAAPGQKYFTWGNDTIGRYWDKLLSDSEQTYCEIQRGRLPSQGITEPIPPQSDDAWTETWMPLNDTDGFSHMENDLVLTTVNADGQATLRLLSAVPRQSLRVQASHDQQPLEAFDVAALEPGRPLVRTLSLKPGQRCNRLVVTDAAGQRLMDWTEYIFPDEDWFSDKPENPFDEQTASVERLFLEAQRLRFHCWPQPSAPATKLYEKVLQIDPGHTGALQALAEVALYAGEFEKAIERVRLALQRKPRDPALQSLLGWALLNLGRADEAVEPFSVAARYEPDRRNGLVGVACAHLRAGRWADALAAAQEVLRHIPADKWARLLKVMALRKLGHRDEAAGVLPGLVRDDPLWSRPHAEALLLGVPLDLAGGARKLGDDSVTAAGYYLLLGMWADAHIILRVDESNEAFSPAVRLSHLAYALHQDGKPQEARAVLDELARAPLAQANAWSVTSIPVLAEMCRLYPDQAKLHAAYGTILGSRCRIDEAAAEWNKARELGLTDAVLEHELGLVAHHKGDKAANLEHFRRSCELSNFDTSAYLALDNLLATMGRHAERLAIFDTVPAEKRRRSAFATRRVLMLLDNSRYQEAYDELFAHDFMIGEFERSIRVYFIEATVALAAAALERGDLDKADGLLRHALIYHRNMNTGRSHMGPDEAVINYFLAMTAEARGDQEAAQKLYLACATEPHYDGSPQQSYELLAWMAMGQRVQAMRLAHRHEKYGRGDAQLADWWRFVYTPLSLKLGWGLAQLAKGRVDEARSIWEKAHAEGPHERWFRMHLDLPRSILERMARPALAPRASRP